MHPGNRAFFAFSLRRPMLSSPWDLGFVETPGRGDQDVDACGVMTSDEMGPKGPGIGADRGTLGDIAADEAASVIELSGAIKWFDVSKGYGFIVPDNGMPDILLHVTCLRLDGFQVAYE